MSQDKPLHYTPSTSLFKMEREQHFHMLVIYNSRQAYASFSSTRSNFTGWELYNLFHFTFHTCLLNFKHLPHCLTESTGSSYT